jgi:hypothetical protein
MTVLLMRTKTLHITVRILPDSLSLSLSHTHTERELGVKVGRGQEVPLCQRMVRLCVCPFVFVCVCSFVGVWVGVCVVHEHGDTMTRVVRDLLHDIRTYTTRTRSQCYV